MQKGKIPEILSVVSMTKKSKNRTKAGVAKKRLVSELNNHILNLSESAPRLLTVKLVNINCNAY